MNNILLITGGFPFGDSERGFIQTEFEKLIECFHVTVLAQDNKESMIYSFPEDVLCEKYHYHNKVRALPHALSQLKRGEICNDIKTACSQGPAFKKVKRFLRIISYGEQSNEIQKQIERIVVEQNIDLIYTYWCTQATVAALRLKPKFPSLRVISRFHGFDLFQERTASGQILRPYIAENSDKLIFVSEDGRQYFINHWGYEEKTSVSYLGTCARNKILPKNNDVLILVSCSRLIPLKRVNLILESLRFLPEEQKVEWHHFGDGKLRNELEADAKKFENTHSNLKCTFHGSVPNQILSNKYQKIGAKLFITASSTEGLPISMTESFSMGIPAVGTKVGGIPELIEDEKTGFLLPANPTPRQIADCIMKYANLSYDKKIKMSDAAYTCWKEKFDAKKNALRFVDMLKQL